MEVRLADLLDHQAIAQMANITREGEGQHFDAKFKLNIYAWDSKCQYMHDLVQPC